MANVALVSLGASASHNKTNHQGTTADMAIDGNPATYSLMQNPAPIIWTVDLGQSRSISQYEVEWVNDSWNAVAYTLQSSPDNSTWTTRHTVTGGTAAGTSGPTNLDTPATARYWRMNTTTGGAEGMGPTVIALYDESLAIGLPLLTNTSVLRPPTQIKDAAIGDNVALVSLGASATASSVAGGPSEQNPSNAIDGNPDSYVLIPGSSGWLRIDLGADYAITAYAVAWVNNSWYASVYDVESSPDGSTWTSRHHKTGGNENPQPLTALTTPFTARYWRLKSTTAPGSGMGPLYFELYTAGVPGNQSLTLPLLTNASVLRAPTVSFPAQAITMPKITNTSVLRAPSVVGLPPSQALTMPKITNTSVLRAPSVVIVPPSQPLTMPKLTNVSVLRAPTITRGSAPGMKAKIFGSTVPFWFPETFSDEDTRKSYLMPYRVSLGGPGLRIVLPGLGARVPIWVEEDPEHPDTYFFPVITDEPIAMGMASGFSAGSGSGPEAAPLSWKGTWASGTDYVEGDVVVQNGSSYAATVDSTGRSPASSPSYWQLLAAKGDTGETGVAGGSAATGEAPMPPPPPATGWSGSLASDPSLHTQNGVMSWAIDGSASESSDYLYRDLARPYNLIAVVAPLMRAADHQGVGLLLFTTEDGKAIHFGVVNNDGVKVQVQRMSDGGDTAGEIVGTVFDLPGLLSHYWLQIEESGDEVFFRVSTDGRNWQQIHSEAADAYTVPDSVGVFMRAYTVETPTSPGPAMSLTGWSSVS